MSLEQLQGRGIGLGIRQGGGYLQLRHKTSGSPTKVKALGDEERNGIISALLDTHDRSFLHHDIHPANILTQLHCEGFRFMFIEKSIKQGWIKGEGNFDDAGPIIKNLWVDKFGAYNWPFDRSFQAL